MKMVVLDGYTLNSGDLDWQVLAPFGALSDEDALVRAMDDGTVAAFATDVMVEEPFNLSHPLVGRENVVLTPHIAWGPRETRARLLNTVVENLQAWLDGERLNRLD